ncbi:MAG: fumarylacetoacetate hydrolase family protein [Burkholderiales bacterium]|nr:fumarylacetoacetate hydrolase family protein [Burkholderiales bacterium]
MTFCSLAGSAGTVSLGVRTERGILDVAKASRLFRIKAPADIHAVIEGADCAPLARLVQKALFDPRGKSVLVAESRARHAPVVPRPEKILCVGLNYRKHAEEAGMPIPPVPILFSKFSNALAGHGAKIKLLPPDLASQFDYEVELVIVIGRKAVNVSEADALKYVFGYCNGNDLSTRDLQLRTSQWMLGKMQDGFAPIGPWLVTADQVPDPNSLHVETRVNGELRQSENTSDMIYGCAHIVSYCSRYLTLRPGDIIFTGTPSGVILGYPQEKRVWLKPGDKVTTTIDKLGTLEVTLAAPSSR